jgi:(p)ppGpp synthase/HD superfamily hydrolase
MSTYDGSIWKKCRDRQCSIEDLHDIVALRVVCSPVAEAGDLADDVARRGQDLCYYLLSIVHKLRPHYVDRVKDYVANKKPNGYQVSGESSTGLRRSGWAGRAQG